MSSRTDVAETKPVLPPDVLDEDVGHLHPSKELR